MRRALKNNGRTPAEINAALGMIRHNIQANPQICDDCWSRPCICLPFSCECGGSITVGGPPDESVEHTSPACEAFRNDPDGTAAEAMGGKDDSQGTRVLARYNRDDVIDAVRKTANVEPKVYECSCGCNAIIAYACNGRVLWVCSQLQIPTDEETRLKLMGLENGDDVTEFMKRVDDAGGAHVSTLHLAESLRSCCDLHRGTESS